MKQIYINPTVKILCLLLLAFVVFNLTIYRILMVLMALVIWQIYLNKTTYLRSVTKAKWLIFMMLVIYAFSTPGEYVKEWPLSFAPSYEGLAQGVLQAGRLCVMLAAISLLNATTTRDDLIAGFYRLLRPLSLFKITPERFAIRLWLTLHYIEINKSQSIKRLKVHERLALLGQIEEYDSSEMTEVTISITPFSYLDKGILLIILTTVVYMCI